MIEAIESRLYGESGTSSAEHALAEIRHQNYKVQLERADLAGDHTGAWVGSMIGDVAGAFISIVGLSAYRVLTESTVPPETSHMVIRLGMFGGLLAGAWIGDKFDHKDGAYSAALNYYNLKDKARYEPSFVRTNPCTRIRESSNPCQ